MISHKPKIFTFLLQLIQTPKEVFADSRLYLDIYIWELPFVFFCNAATEIFTALGDSKTPFYFLTASSTSNITVDIPFVKAFKMEVAGVAWAAFLCQGVSCITAVLAVWARLKKTFLKKILAIAVPNIFQQSFISVGNILIQIRLDKNSPGHTVRVACGLDLRYGPFHFLLYKENAENYSK